MGFVDIGPIFEAQWDQHCTCGEPVDQGDEARTAVGDLIGQRCCGQDLEAANKEEMGAWG